jgi:hypothetical protein
MANDAATMGEVYSAIKVDGYRLADFKREWAGLTETDKAQLRAGVGNGSLTY